MRASGAPVRMHPAWLIAAACFALLMGIVCAARGDDDSGNWACNPRGTDAVLYGSLQIEAPIDRAPMNLTIHTSFPAARRDGDSWLINTVNTHQLCYRSGSADYCMNMEAQ